MEGQYQKKEIEEGVTSESYQKGRYITETVTSSIVRKYNISKLVNTIASRHNGYDIVSHSRTEGSLWREDIFILKKH